MLDRSAESTAEEASISKVVPTASLSLRNNLRNVGQGPLAIFLFDASYS